LLDEPTSNLDVDTEARVLAGLQKRVRPDATMVLVTHKLQLLGLVHRVILVANGQIVLDGPTAEVLKQLQPKPPERRTAPITTQTVGVKK
jgi:ATP-binding cassette subfamily C protein LapB